MGGAPFTGRAADLTTLDGWARSVDPVMVIEALGGTGKSALTWQWAAERAPEAIDGLAGRLWWSFYEGSASMTRFLQELLAYTTARPMDEVRELDRASLAEEALTALRQRPYLIVLDGFERLLAAYHRFDPSKLRDEEVDPDKRSLIEPQAEEFVHRLAAAGPSKILVSTRLMPTALQGRFGQRLAGVRRVRLPGLTDTDTQRLLTDLDVRGSDAAVTGFFHPLGNHPLLIGIVAGLVRDYRAEPGGFDRWLADPTAGGALRLPELKLTQRQAHILAAALDGLDPGSRQLLGWISVLAGAVSWATLEAINPFRPEPPAPSPPVYPPYALPGGADFGQWPAATGELTTETAPPALPAPPVYPPYGLPGGEDFGQWPAAIDEPATETAPPEYSLYPLPIGEDYEQWSAAMDELTAKAERRYQEQLAAWRSSEPVMRATAQLGAALKDLEDRGLLWWDRAASNTYDLHPIVRAYAHDQLEDTDRVRANDRVRDHFQALPPEDPDSATSVEDLSQTITIFRALVGAGHLYEASAVWESLKPALLVKVGAYATITELLAPLASTDELVALAMRDDLSIAYGFLGQNEAAIRQQTELIARVLRSDTELVTTEVAARWVSVKLGTMAEGFRLNGAHIAAARCLELGSAMNAAAGIEQDAGLDLAFAVQAVTQGQTELARDFLNKASSIDPPPDDQWFAESLEVWWLYLAFVTNQSLTSAQFDDAATRATSWLQRRNLAELRSQFFIRNAQYELALAAADEGDQLGRNAGLDIAPACSAYLLAKLGRSDEATAAAEDALLRLNRIHPARRPYRYLALALRELRRADEARAYARPAYRQAWGDGPPYCHFWQLRAARELLDSIGEPIPDLPVTDPATVKVPLEDEIRAFIADLEEAGPPEDAG